MCPHPWQSTVVVEVTVHGYIRNVPSKEQTGQYGGTEDIVCVMIEVVVHPPAALCVDVGVVWAYAAGRAMAMRPYTVM